MYFGGTDEDGERVSGKFGVLCDSAMTKDMLIVKFFRVEDLVNPF